MSGGAPAAVGSGSDAAGLRSTGDCEEAFTVVITGEPGAEEEAGALIETDFTCGVTAAGAAGPTAVTGVADVVEVP